MINGIPPTACRSVATYLPDGFMFAITGTRSRIRSKSSSSSFTSLACAIASRCRTALVEPPVAITTLMAFSNACLVMISRGRKSRLTSSSSASPLSLALSRFSASSAAMVDEPGRLMPIASMALLMVFAVYIPPHEPLPGQARRSISKKSASLSAPAPCSPTASKTLTTVRSRPA